MPRSWITKDGTCGARWTGLRNTASEESIKLRRIAQINASRNLAPAAGRRRGRGRRCDSATPADRLLHDVGVAAETVKPGYNN